MLRVRDIPMQELEVLLQRFKLQLTLLDDGEPVTGSFWGNCEAGIVGDTVFVRSDTPIHSLLHEACHVICMTTERRRTLFRDAGGDDLEEAAVCYLQILLADSIADAGRQRIMQDMDAWGYSFRLGSTRAWFEDDAEDAREFLIKQQLIDEKGVPTFKLRP